MCCVYLCVCYISLVRLKLTPSLSSTLIFLSLSLFIFMPYTEDSYGKSKDKIRNRCALSGYNKIIWSQWNYVLKYNYPAEESAMHIDWPHQKITKFHGGRDFNNLVQCQPLYLAYSKQSVSINWSNEWKDGET